MIGKTDLVPIQICIMEWKCLNHDNHMGMGFMTLPIFFLSRTIIKTDRFFKDHLLAISNGHSNSGIFQIGPKSFETTKTFPRHFCFWLQPTATTHSEQLFVKHPQCFLNLNKLLNTQFHWGLLLLFLVSSGWPYAVQSSQKRLNLHDTTTHPIYCNWSDQLRSNALGE